MKSKGEVFLVENDHRKGEKRWGVGGGEGVFLGSSPRISPKTVFELIL